jgi:hypothetical protein
MDADDYERFLQIKRLLGPINTSDNETDRDKLRNSSKIIVHKRTVPVCSYIPHSDHPYPGDSAQSILVPDGI